jgi:endoglucanase
MAGLLPAVAASAAPDPADAAPAAARAAAASSHEAGATSAQARRARRLAVRRRAARLATLRRAEARPPSPFATTPLFVDPAGPARAQARAWREARPADAALMDDLALQPTGLWLGDWTPVVRATVSQRVAAARATGSMPLLVAYNIPGRDCGQHSSGGAPSAAAYRRWIADLAAGIRDASAAVILEPDALAGAGCLGAAERRERMELLSDAVATLERRPRTAVYIDAGNPGWTGPREMARRLRAAGIDEARGFAVNVSSFNDTASARAYGRAVSRLVDFAPFVIDTSRNGAGASASGDWCNPPGMALGARPTADTGDPLIDAFLWVKRPGESDGTCNGGPPAGEWWGDYALGLAQRAAAAPAP